MLPACRFGTLAQIRARLLFPRRPFFSPPTLTPLTSKAYEVALAELRDDKPRYEETMTAAFVYCQDLEQQRQDFLKTVMLRYFEILNLHTPTQCRALKQNIDRVNPDADLLHYAEFQGTGMALCVPSFQKWGAAPTIELVAPNNTRNGSAARLGQLGNGVRLVSLRRAKNSAGGNIHGRATNDDDLAEDDDGESDVDSGEEEEEEEEDWEPADPPTPQPPEMMTKLGGIRMRAIYDYGGMDVEELSFKAGDFITEIEPEDDQGWCRGVDRNGTTGLYPACYVEEASDEEA
jgi:hypothetical protein